MRSKISRLDQVLNPVRVFLFLLAVGVCASLAFAQLPTATILGVVRDSSGAVVPGATLTVTNTETGFFRTTNSGNDGSYRFPALPVGSYEVRTEHAGFQSAVRSGLRLTVGQEAVVNFTVEVGAVTQTIAVTAEAPLVNTTSGSLGGLVNEDRVAELPLNGRNFTDLTLLQTGVVEGKRTQGVGGGSTGGVWFSSGGAPYRSNSFLLDGAEMRTVHGGAASSIAGTTLGIEGIREFRVITSNFPAQYGMTMGSVTTVVSKSGTNQWHGSAFEFLRNSALDARNFFDRKTEITPRRLPNFVRNNFGGSGGGPVVRDRFFFFAAYEGVRERKGLSTISKTLPASDKVDGGRVPRIDPRVKGLLKLYPDPNLPATDEFTFPFSQQISEDFGQIRLDHTVSDKDSWFGRFTTTDSRALGVGNFPAFTAPTTGLIQLSTLSWNRVFTPTLLNTFRFSYSRTEILPRDGNTELIGPEFSFSPGLLTGQLSVGGLTQNGGSLCNPLDHNQRVFTWGDDMFSSRGRHSLQFGALINRYHLDVVTSCLQKGILSFPSVPAFLLAQPTVFSAVTPGSNLGRAIRYTTLGFYLQDDFRVRVNFTLNLGLRYEFITEPTEANGIGSAVRDLLNDSGGTVGNPIKNPSLRNFSPRFGFAWDVQGNGQTAVRGGFSVLYDIGNLGGAITGAVLTPPFASVTQVGGPAAASLFDIPFPFSRLPAGRSFRLIDYNLQQPHLLHYNLTVERQLPWNTGVSIAYAGSRGINIFQTREGNPRVADILPDGRKFYPAPPPGQIDPRRLNRNFDSLELKTAGGNSWYNSLQLSVIKRLSQGWQFQSSYTYSKVIDDTQGQTFADVATSSTFPTDPDDRRVDRGPAAFDATHNWRFNAIYRIPNLVASGGAAGRLLNGWWFSGILSLQTGLPFTPRLSANRSRSGVNAGREGDRPDLAPGRSFDGIVSSRDVHRYFDPTAFAVPEAGFLGNAGRNILRGPGLANLDFSVAKDTPLRYLGETGKLEFRAEFFNILNRANFAQPDRFVFAGNAVGEAPLPTAGRISNTAMTSRQLQFALKLIW